MKKTLFNQEDSVTENLQFGKTQINQIEFGKTSMLTLQKTHQNYTTSTHTKTQEEIFLILITQKQNSY